MAQATDGHHTTLGELVPAQVSCWREVQSGGNPPPNTSEDGGRGLAASYKWAWAHIPCQTLQVGHGQVMKWVVDAARTRVVVFLPRRSSSWAQTVRTHISLLTTYTRRRLGDEPGMLSATPSPTPTGGESRGPGPAHPIHCLSQLTPSLVGVAPRVLPQPSPVEADLIETLFTRLVDGVEASAWVLFLTAVWGQVGPDWRLSSSGRFTESESLSTLRPCPGPHTNTAPR